jgi:hypothetical protein
MLIDWQAVEERLLSESLLCIAQFANDNLEEIYACFGIGIEDNLFGGFGIGFDSLANSMFKSSAYVYIIIKI